MKLGRMVLTPDLDAILAQVPEMLSQSEDAEFRSEAHVQDRPKCFEL